MNILRNRKAQAFGMFFVIAVLLIMGYATFTFLTQKRFSGAVSTPLELSNLYQDSEKFLFFAKNAGEISIANAYNSIASESLFVGPEVREFEGGYLNFRSLASDINQKMSEKTTEDFNKLIKQYPDERFNGMSFKVSVSDGAVTFEGEEKEMLASVNEGFFPFSASYKFKPSFQIKLTDVKLTDFPEIYNAAIDCKRGENSEVVKTCIEKLENLQATISSQENKVIFELETKKSFFLTEGDNYNYKPIKMSFFMEVLINLKG